MQPRSPSGCQRSASFPSSPRLILFLLRELRPFQHMIALLSELLNSARYEKDVIKAFLRELLSGFYAPALVEAVNDYHFVGAIFLCRSHKAEYFRKYAVACNIRSWEGNCVFDVIPLIFIRLPQIQQQKLSLRLPIPHR